MDDEDIFLFCSNMSLEQYRAIALARGLTGGAGCLVSLTVLVIVLLVAKKKTWEKFSKRIYFALIPYTFLYSIASIAAVNYNHPPSEESTWCEVRGFFLHHFGTLVFVHFCVLAIALMLQITISLKLAPCQAIKDKLSLICSRKAEALLFFILFLLPLPDTLAPFSPQLPSYGNFGPLCWFRLELTKNCTVSTFDISFLHTVPFAIICFACCVLTLVISLMILCGLYLKYRNEEGKIGRSIGRYIPTMVILTVLTFIMTGWYIVSAVTAKNFRNSFSDWLREATVTLAATVGILVATGIYIHFPTHLCDLCKRAHRGRQASAVSRRRALQIQVGPHNPPVQIPAGHTPNLKQPSKTSSVRQPSSIRSQPIYAGSHKSLTMSTVTQKSSQTHSLNKSGHIQSQPSHTESHISYKPVTTTQEAASQPSHTESHIVHEPVTTLETGQPSVIDTESHIFSHETVTTTQEPSQPSATESHIFSHETVTTTQEPSQPSATESHIFSHETVTTTQDCTETTPLLSHKK